MVACSKQADKGVYLCAHAAVLEPVENAVTVGMLPDEEQLIPPEQVA